MQSSTNAASVYVINHTILKIEIYLAVRNKAGECKSRSYCLEMRNKVREGMLPKVGNGEPGTGVWERVKGGAF